MVDRPLPPERHAEVLPDSYGFSLSPRPLGSAGAPQPPRPDDGREEVPEAH
jgi:hypothetical protein